jgi:hypothetical protein
MNHIYGVNKSTYARYCTETDIFFKLPELDPDPDLVVNYPDPAKRSGFGSATLHGGVGFNGKYKMICSEKGKVDGTFPLPLFKA